MQVTATEIAQRLESEAGETLEGSYVYRKTLEPVYLYVNSDFLENTPMPKVTIEQAKFLLVYQALRDNNWHRRKAWQDLKMPERTFRYYVRLLVKYGFVKSKFKK